MPETSRREPIAGRRMSRAPLGIEMPCNARSLRRHQSKMRKEIFPPSKTALTRFSKKTITYSPRERSKVQFRCVARRISARENPFNRRKPYQNKPENTALTRSEVNLDQINC